MQPAYGSGGASGGEPGPLESSGESEPSESSGAPDGPWPLESLSSEPSSGSSVRFLVRGLVRFLRLRIPAAFMIVAIVAISARALVARSVVVIVAPFPRA